MYLIFDGDWTSLSRVCYGNAQCTVGASHWVVSNNSYTLDAVKAYIQNKLTRCYNLYELNRGYSKFSPASPYL
jgi:hypothetical protein